MTPQRRRNLTAALGFAHLVPRAPELRLLHRWLDTWAGLGLVVVGVEWQGSSSCRWTRLHVGRTLTIPVSTSMSCQCGPATSPARQPDSQDRAQLPAG
jgi:hypothetical protein